MRNFPVLMFAAGFGTRMGALTRDRPKPLIEVAGKPLIDHALTLARDAGCDHIVANLHYRADMLSRHLEPVGVRTITEEPKILETGGGLRNALPFLGQGPVLTMNTDAIWAGPNPVKLLKAAWMPDRMDALMMTVPVARAIGQDSQGDFTRAESGQLFRGPGVIYGGIQIIKTDLLERIEQEAFSLNLIWDLMLERDRLFGLAYPGRWCDVGHPGGIRLAEKMLGVRDV
ncbi:MAG: nucleotidyltransferase family protein [Sulfitobacter sp.]|nr:nucleotidyltransferase family protein [Sulfitobacter sp.]